MTCVPALFACTFLAADEPKLVLPEGHVAYALNTEQSPNSSFLIPGSRVDVLVDEKAGVGKIRITIAKKGLLIVAVDAFSNKTFIVVTVAIKKEEAKAMADAVKRGDIRLTIAKPADKAKDKEIP